MREKSLFWTYSGPQFSIQKIILCNIFARQNVLLLKEITHVVLQGKICQKETILLEDSCLVLYLPDVEMRICQVKL